MMERKLEQYRKTCKRRHLIGFALEVLMSWVVIAQLFLNSWALIEGRPTHNPMSIVYVILGFAALMKIRQNPEVLKDDALLRKAYLEEHDERNVAIRAKAGQPVVQYLSLLLLLTGSLLEFMDFERFMPVAMTLELVGVALLLISWALKKYWEKRM